MALVKKADGTLLHIHKDCSLTNFDDPEEVTNDNLVTLTWVNLMLQQGDIVELDIYCETYGDDIIEYIADNLKKNTNLTKFFLCDFAIKKKGAILLVELFNDLHNITKLHLSGIIEFEAEAAMVIANALHTDVLPNLSDLVLYNIGVNDASASVIASALYKRPLLKSLDLFCNDITNLGAAVLNEASEKIGGVRINLEDEEFMEGDDYVGWGTDYLNIHEADDSSLIGSDQDY